MLFSEDIRKTCALCEYAVPIDEDTVLCRKKGPMGAEDTCRKFVLRLIRASQVSCDLYHSSSAPFSSIQNFSISIR